MSDVVVTGGTGFLGRHVVRELERRGHKPIVLGRDGVDLRDRHAAVNAIDRGGFGSMVIHCAAACGGIGANVAKPADFFRDNLEMGLNVLAAAYHVGVRKVVLIGSCCAYPLNAPLPLREHSLWDGYPEPTNAPYGIAKRAIIEAGLAYRKQYGLNVVSVIPGNLYGPEDNFDLETSHVIPAIIRKMTDARDAGQDSVTLWGSGKPTRDFLHVEDCARGVVDALERYDGAEPINLGTGAECPISSVAHYVANSLGLDSRKIVWDTSRPDGQPRRWLDTSRARDRLGWTARKDLAQGLSETVRWWQAQAAEVV